ncbi:MAG: metallophosphoesterase [Paenibacillus sp. RIFOXYA1_FULL_44_5]|nr:MAG: metallophosphoesterase [Paenibacillus sp. RIFOXYA1_FULL_44_5]
MKEETTIKVLFIGDIVGSTGRKALKENISSLKKKWSPDFIVANGENAAAGRGITREIAMQFFDAGIHGLTMGNHTWDHKDIFNFIENEGRIIRPANFPPGTPGKGFTTLKNNGKELVIINLQGRTFLPPLECPFTTADEIIKQLNKKNKHILVDFHAEATSEKISFGWYLDGKVSAIVGTHTHVQTNDERILPKGTAYVTDVGMVGPRDGVLGMEKTAVIQKFVTQLPVRFVVDEGKWQFHAVFLNLDDQTGMATQIKLIRINEDEVIIE